MKLISWNVNGIRACLKKGFIDFFESIDADIFCLQETKMEKGQAEYDFSLNGKYLEYWNSADKKGYSGTAVFTKIKPINVYYGIGIDMHDHEGRVITLEFNDYYFVCCYTPNSKRELERLEYRTTLWDVCFREYLIKLDKLKPVILCGDLNCAHTENDIKNAKSNVRNAGFTIEEINSFSKLLDCGFIDTYRYFNKDKKDAYTWWSMMPGVREKNIGWRIDYFVVSNRLITNIKEPIIYDKIYGSDHCPVGINI